MIIQRAVKGGEQTAREEWVDRESTLERKKRKIENIIEKGKSERCQKKYW